MTLRSPSLPAAMLEKAAKKLEKLRKLTKSKDKRSLKKKKYFPTTKISGLLLSGQLILRELDILVEKMLQLHWGCCEITIFFLN